MKCTALYGKNEIYNSVYVYKCVVSKSLYHGFFGQVVLGSACFDSVFAALNLHKLFQVDFQKHKESHN